MLLLTKRNALAVGMMLYAQATKLRWFRLAKAKRKQRVTCFLPGVVGTHFMHSRWGLWKNSQSFIKNWLLLLY